MSINLAENIEGLHFSKEHWRLWYLNDSNELKGFLSITDIVTASSVNSAVDMYSDQSITLVAGMAIYRLYSDGSSVVVLDETSSETPGQYSAIGYNHIDNTYIAYDNDAEKFVESSDGTTWTDSTIPAPTGGTYGYTDNTVRRIRSNEDYLIISVTGDGTTQAYFYIWDGSSWTQPAIYPEYSVYDYFATSNFELWNNRLFYINNLDELCYYDIGSEYAAEHVIDTETYTCLKEGKYHIYAGGYDTVKSKGFIKYFDKNAKCALDLRSSADSAVLLIEMTKDYII